MKIDIILYVLSAIVLLLSFLATFSPDPISTNLWVIITDLGSETYYMIFAIIIFHLIKGRIGFITILALLLSGSLNILIKEIAKMPRPPNPKIEETGYGFPSGHAQTSSSFWFILYLMIKKFPLLILSLVIIASVSASRIALNVHYLQDVIGGILIGLAIAFLIFFIFNTKISTLDFILPIIIFIFSMLNFLIFVQNYTLIRISGIAIGITLYPAFLRLKLIKEDEKINIKYKLIFLIINLLVALVLTRIPLKEFLQIIPYILIGLSLPIFKFLTFYTENKFKK
jgi:membrane-associated phospholipid phosphatase